MKALLFGLACALAAQASFAEHLGFKGIELGSDIARIATDPRFDCHILNTPISEKVCNLRPRETETIAGVAAVSLFYFYDHAGLTGIQVTVAEKDFQKVIDALVGKYGRGTLATEKVTNLNGTAFENRTWTWKKPEGSLHAERYAGRLDRSLIRFTDDSAAQRLQQRRSLLAKDPRKDL